MNIQDPSLVSELYTTKNHLVDKNGELRDWTTDLMGESFLFSKNDAVWKVKRQACSHAFYKEKLLDMVEVMKEITATKFETWIEEIKNSQQKTHVVDTTTEFADIMARNIITIAFGEDVNDELFELKVRKKQRSSEFVT